MIAYIEGKIAQKDPTFVIIDVGGIGYKIRVSLTTFAALGDEIKCKLWTYLHIKEDAHTLYGFSEMGEKELFLLLISISGVGANTALVILSSMDIQELEGAIGTGDVRKIQSVKGIGTKTAERIVLELRDKVGKMTIPAGATKSHTIYNNTKNEALNALMSLGIAKASAEKSIDTVFKKHGNNLTVEEIIKLALKQGA